MLELQKAVSAAEQKATEMVSAERIKMERSMSDSRKKIREEVMAQFNHQEESSEVRENSFWFSIEILNPCQIFISYPHFGSCNKFPLFCIIESLFGPLSCTFVWCRDYTLVYRVAGTVVGRPVRHAVVVMWHGTADPSASTRIGRTTTMCVASHKWACPRPDRTALHRRCTARRSPNTAPVKPRRSLLHSPPSAPVVQPPHPPRRHPGQVHPQRNLWMW